MSLIFGAFVPHSVQLIPNAGAAKDFSLLKKTRLSLEELEGELYTMQPDTLLIISPHSQITPKSFALNLAPEYTSDFSNFGINDIKLTFPGDAALVSAIKEKADALDVPVNLISQTHLDYGVSVPLYYLTQHLPKIKIIPISYSQLDYKKHFAFGEILRSVSIESNKRIAIIASGNLSHQLNANSPTGFTPEGPTLDQIILKILNNRNYQDLLKINPQITDAANECGLRSLLILIGALEKSKHETNVLSYESPLGIGNLVTHFCLK